jgi:PiT family inorganic phosphate transporter
MDQLMLLFALIGMGLIWAFSFTNGFQDGATTAATLVASKAATPRQGLFLVASLGALGTLLGGSAVAFTITGLIDVDDADAVMVITLSALAGAIAWNMVTWYFGIPCSTTQSLVGGLVGAGVAVAGVDSVNWGWSELMEGELTGLMLVIVFLVVSIFFGLLGGYLLFKLTKWMLRGAKRSINRRINQAQWLATSVFAFSNGANDSQKFLGLIILILISTGFTSTEEIPLWTRLFIALAIGLGTIIGGRRILKTLASKIYSIAPIHSLDSQIVSGTALTISTVIGAPISSTQVVSSSILGIGAADRPRYVRWAKANELVVSWLLTIPASALVSGLIGYAFDLFYIT